MEGRGASVLQDFQACGPLVSSSQVASVPEAFGDERLQPSRSTALESLGDKGMKGRGASAL
jgi:hypothetical protein